jgi:Rad3-related DNA helicase
LIYSGTEEKKQKLEELKVMKNGILIGPSLTTGIDLPDELSRLQLWIKMPFLSLSDRFVKVKMENNWG